MTNFRLQNSKVFADDNFKHDENGVKFSEQVENTVGNRKIACYEHFLFFLQCFQKNLNFKQTKTGACLEKN